MGKNIDSKVIITLILLGVAISAAVYYTSYREITDPQVLIAKTVDASKDIKSYRFVLSTDLRMPAGDLMIRGDGSVDYSNKKLHATMTMMNRSLEMIVINDTAYVRESYGSWQKQDLDERSLWENYDQLAQQRSILLNATNVTMQEEDRGWIVIIFPDRREVIEQMKQAGLERLKEEDLRDFTMNYWIEQDSYHITRIENKIEFTMDIQGMVTPVRLTNSVNLSDYNKKMEIEAPIS